MSSYLSNNKISQTRRKKAKNLSKSKREGRRNKERENRGKRKLYILSLLVEYLVRPLSHFHAGVDRKIGCRKDCKLEHGYLGLKTFSLNSDVVQNSISKAQKMKKVIKNLTKKTLVF